MTTVLTCNDAFIGGCKEVPASPGCFVSGGPEKLARHRRAGCGPLPQRLGPVAGNRSNDVAHESTEGCQTGAFGSRGARH